MTRPAIRLAEPGAPMRVALSVRQPWSWAIIHAGKDVENRSDAAIRHMDFRRVHRLAIHASKGMTQDEYEHARAFMGSIGVNCPLAADLLRGGVIGSVAVIGIVKNSGSPWFFGPRGILLKSPEPCEFSAGPGAFGLFDWAPKEGAAAETPALWMTREKNAVASFARVTITRMIAPSLFRDEDA